MKNRSRCAVINLNPSRSFQRYIDFIDVLEVKRTFVIDVIDKYDIVFILLNQVELEFIKRVDFEILKSSTAWIVGVKGIGQRNNEDEVKVMSKLTCINSWIKVDDLSYVRDSIALMNGIHQTISSGSIIGLDFNDIKAVMDQKVLRFYNIQNTSCNGLKNSLSALYEGMHSNNASMLSIILLDYKSGLCEVSEIITEIQKKTRSTDDFAYAALTSEMLGLYLFAEDS